jgi:hypothetical protein
MSTPRGKPPNPIALSTHVSHKAHEGAVTEPPRSPYAPKQAHQRAGTEHHPVENDRDPLRSPYAPKQARAQGAASDFVAGDDPGRLPRTRRGLREHIARYDVGSHEAVHPNIGRREQLAAEHHDPSKGDRDLEQLEASLRLLQRQESATRSPRATHAPVPGPARRQSGERFGDRFRSPRSLEAERLPPPPEMPRRNIGALVGSVLALILLATIVYHFAAGDWAPSSEPAPGPQTASDPAVVASPPSWSMGQQAPPPTMAQDDNRSTSAQTSQSIKTSQPPRSPEGETGAIVQPDEPAAQIPPASKATRVLDPEETTLLIKQGEQFIAAGDVVTARIAFQRAAEAGDADAALALGATYDPIVLANLGVAGLGANVEKARIWYQKAENLGSTDATRRLAILENR